MCGGFLSLATAVVLAMLVVVSPSVSQETIDGGAAPPPPTIDQALRQELLEMAALDLGGVPDIRQKNQAALAQILEARGWPGISLVGLDGSRATWLIAQHADYDVPLQKRCLELIQGAVLKGEVETQALAYLTDRILSNEGKPQLYGTQGIGVISPEDEARVDANRKALGLEPWRAYMQKRKRLPQSGKPYIAPWEDP